MAFIHEDFLLGTKTARKLYHKFAEAEPIFDYHCHISPHDIAANRQFKNLFEIWLEGDHYKWRAMRANGVAKNLSPHDASPRDKFLAWAKNRSANAAQSALSLDASGIGKRLFRYQNCSTKVPLTKSGKRRMKILNTPALTTHGILKNSA